MRGTYYGNADQTLGTFELRQLRFAIEKEKERERKRERERERERKRERSGREEGWEKASVESE